MWYDEFSLLLTALYTCSKHALEVVSCRLGKVVAMLSRAVSLSDRL